MFKLIAKLALIVALLTALLWYIHYLMTGESSVMPIPNSDIFDLSKISDMSAATITEKIAAVKTGKRDDDTNYIYKWRAENGVIHYTSEQPAAGIHYESIPYHKETNVIPATTTKTLQQTTDTEPNPESNPQNVYSIDGINQLFDQANAVQEQVNQRFNRQQGLIQSN